MKLSGAVLGAAVFLVGCAGAPDRVDPPLQLQRRVPAPLAVVASDDSAVAEYDARYGFPGVPGRRFGRLVGPGDALACQVWPEGSRGTVFVLHGYLDHMGQAAPAIRELVAADFSVVAFDLPGHGLSEGPRMGLDSISTYVAALDSVFRVAARLGLPRPWIALGHSTGGAVLLEAARRPDFPLQAVILVAPLVRHAWWRLSGAFLPVAGLVTDSVDRRRKIVSTHDTAFQASIARDPLQGRVLPFSWERAVRRWEATLDTGRWAPVPWLWLQGGADRVVDGSHGEGWARSHLENIRIVEVPGAYHHLLEEAEPWRSRAWVPVRAFLDSVAPPLPDPRPEG